MLKMINDSASIAVFHDASTKQDRSYGLMDVIISCAAIAGRYVDLESFAWLVAAARIA